MGHFLSKPNLNSSPYDFKDEQIPFKNGIITYAGTSVQGWRACQEDSFIVKKNLAKDTHLFAVFDGHGGPEVADYCSDKFCDVLLRQPTFLNQTNFKKALTDAIYELNDFLRTESGKQYLDKIYQTKKQEMMKEKNKIKEAQQDDEDLTDVEDNDYGEEEDQHSVDECGATANIVLLTPQKIFCANVGDSRSALHHSGNQIQDLSSDHKPDNQQEQQRIEKAGGRVYKARVNGNLSVSRSIGDIKYKRPVDFKNEDQMISCQPDIFEIDIENIKPNFIVLACDGIWECDQKFRIMPYFKDSLVDQKQPILDSIKNCFTKVMARDPVDGIGCDNMTLLVVKFD